MPQVVDINAALSIVGSQIDDYTYNGRPVDLAKFDGICVLEETPKFFRWGLGYGYRGEAEIHLLPASRRTPAPIFYLDQFVEYLRRENVVPFILEGGHTPVLADSV